MMVIGRALMAEPRLLLLDEPSLGLAPKIVDQVYEIVADICRQLDLAALEATGRLHIEQVDAAELTPGEFTHRVCGNVDRGDRPEFELAIFDGGLGPGDYAARDFIL